jgi:outer membrane protein assembly factor BamB
MLRRGWVGLVSIGLCGAAWGADWPQWRGPNRDGISPETGLLDSWPQGGPRLLWRLEGLGEGYSSSAVADGRLFTQGQKGETEFVLAFDANTGAQLWRVETGHAFREQRGYGPRGTPTIDGDRLYALAADGMLVCLETGNGKRIWGMNIVDRFHGRVLHWGISESPLVEGDRVIVTPGGSGAAVVALDKMTGKVLWQSQSDEAGYSSPVAFDAGGARKVVVFTGEGAIGLDLKNGELQWRYNKVANRTANIATPIVHDGYVFLSSDYGTGCALLKLAPQAGSVAASEVYFNRDMRNHYSTSVLVGDTLYGYSSSILTAMKFQTGEVLWRDRAVGKGSVIYADRHLYCLSEDGIVGLVEASPAGYREKSRFEIPKGQFPTWSPPVIANGKMYLREQNVLYCFHIKR